MTNFDLEKKLFVVLHNLPSNQNDLSSVMNVLNSKKIPRMFIVGTQTNLPRFNQIQPLLTIKGDATNPNPVQSLCTAVVASQELGVSIHEAAHPHTRNASAEPNVVTAAQAAQNQRSATGPKASAARLVSRDSYARVSRTAGLSAFEFDHCFSQIVKADAQPAWGLAQLRVFSGRRRS